MYNTHLDIMFPLYVVITENVHFYYDSESFVPVERKSQVGNELVAEDTGLWEPTGKF